MNEPKLGTNRVAKQGKRQFRGPHRVLLDALVALFSRCGDSEVVHPNSFLALTVSRQLQFNRVYRGWTNGRKKNKIESFESSERSGLLPRCSPGSIQQKKMTSASSIFVSR